VGLTGGRQGGAAAPPVAGDKGARERVVYGAIGTVLDRGAQEKRWQRWRPTVAAGLHPALAADRLELLISHGEASAQLGQQVLADLAERRPGLQVRLHTLPPTPLWDLEAVYDVLAEHAAGMAFDEERHDVLAHVTTGTHIMQICMYLLVESRILPGRLLQTNPNRSDPVLGGFDIIDLNLGRYDRLHRRFEAARREATGLLKDGIETRNAAFNQLIDEIEQVAGRSSAPVLIWGPTGAGKSQLARRIYALKRARGRVKGSFVELNCATLRGDAAMSALFGHTKGAFTGALSERAGLLRAANDGLLFLDEIGELGLDEQAMLLRAIEDGRFLPVGADREVESRFQLLAGTNRDLLARVREGRFREDLLARIHTWTFRLPGLVERPEDIEPNLDHELARQGAALGRRLSMSREARAAYLRFALGPGAPWSGNFRDLGASVQRMATLAEGGRVDEAAVAAELRRLSASWGPAAPAPAVIEDDVAERLLDALLSAEQRAALDPFDAVQLGYTLRVCRGAESLSAAGRTLFSASRLQRASTNDADRLRKYLGRWGLRFEQIRACPLG
jgi:transcriptional regulatory protein RtcR